MLPILFSVDACVCVCVYGGEAKKEREREGRCLSNKQTTAKAKRDEPHRRRVGGRERGRDKKETAQRKRTGKDAAHFTYFSERVLYKSTTSN